MCSAPCKGCNERSVEPNCHSYCERYLSFKEEDQKQKDALREAKEKHNIAYMFRREQVEKALKRRGR